MGEANTSKRRIANGKCQNFMKTICKALLNLRSVEDAGSLCAWRRPIVAAGVGVLKVPHFPQQERRNMPEIRDLSPSLL